MTAQHDEDDLTPQETLGLAIYSWASHLRRTGDAITPRMLSDALLAGLKAAGIKAEHPARFAGGKHAGTREMAVQFQCPYWHRAEDRGTFASVCLIAEDDGWPTIDPKSLCPHCTDEALQRWFLTCPRCEAGEDSWDHEPDHDAGGTGDSSPYAYVLNQFIRLGMRAEAAWWVNHTDAARAQYLRGRDDDPVIRRLANDHVTWAHQILNVTTVQITRRVEWTDESAAEWLDRQATAEGDPLVPVEATQRDAWSGVQALAGRPPKNRIEAAQTLRKARL